MDGIVIYGNRLIPAHQSFPLVAVGREKNLPTLHFHLRHIRH